MIFKLRPEESEGKSNLDMRKKLLGKEKRYRGPEKTAYLACSRHRMKASIVRAERIREGGVAGDHSVRSVEKQGHRRFWLHGKNLGACSE